MDTLLEIGCINYVAKNLFQHATVTVASPAYFTHAFFSAADCQHLLLLFTHAYHVLGGYHVVVLSGPESPEQQHPCSSAQDPGHLGAVTLCLDLIQSCFCLFSNKTTKLR